jgi:hypothetical protein
MGRTRRVRLIRTSRPHQLRAAVDSPTYGQAFCSRTSRELPDWKTCDDRLITEGQAARLIHGSEANITLDFPLPVE